VRPTTSRERLGRELTAVPTDSPAGMLYVALATASKQLIVARVAISWGLPEPDKQVPPGGVPLQPSLHEQPVAVTTWLQPSATSSPLDASMAQLSHVEMLPSAPPVPQPTQQAFSPPLVLTVRTHIPSSSSSYSQELQSIIDRWEVLSDASQTIHPAFEQLGSRSGQNSAPQARASKQRRPRGSPLTADRALSGCGSWTPS